MKRKIYSLTLVLALTLAFAVPALADIPAPPANQQVGIPDGIFNSLAEADCRLCHGPTPLGRCSISDINCTVDADCLATETCVAIPVDTTYLADRHHLLVGTPVPDPTDRPFPDGDTGGNYDCFSCHDLVWDPVSMTFVLETFRDCTFCHVQDAGESTVHHRTVPAQNRDCVHCHGDLVDNFDDGHTIPTYPTSLVTPTRSGGDGLPLNSEGNGAGACNYCHSTGTGTSAPGTDTDTGTFVYRNSDTHHNTGFFNQGVCNWCHNFGLPFAEQIRACEECHGFESLHNIQTDSPAAGNLGTIDPGNEDMGYGHIGNNDDCWGCHGFDSASAPGMGPVIPFISSADTFVMTAGTDTTVTLTGAAFTNTLMDGAITLESDVELTASDGSVTTLTPDSVTESDIVVTLPGSLTEGNYDLRAVKGPSGSNPVVISIKPDVTVTGVSCDKKKGVLTINGSGFGTKPEGTDAYINVEINGQPVDIISWSDTRVKASVSGCPGNASTTVNALYGSDSSGGGGKPPKPCKGKGCNK